MIVEVKREIDFDSLDPLDDEPNDEDTEQGAFGDFVQQVRQILPVNAQNVDVYIGWWGDQSTFTIPQAFFELIAETKWAVTFDIND